MRRASVSIISLIAASMTLSACGGGSTSGGSGPGTTPPPPTTPTTPVGENSDLIALTKSENFTNDAATASVSVDNAGNAKGTASAATATFYYDAGKKSYTLTVGGRTIEFSPSNIDNAQSNATVTVYMKKNGNTTDSLTLTKPSTAGRFTYKYVGGGYWQKATVNNTSGSGSLDAFTYGAETPNAAVPRTGRAEYAVDFLAVEAQGSYVQGVTGQGLAQVDLGKGILTISGTMGPNGSETTNFNSRSSLSSTSNAFSGGFSYSNYSGTAVGGIRGRFYGPQAQEIGAAFSGSNSSSGLVVAGTVLGRGGAVPYLPYTAANATAPSASASTTYDRSTKTYANATSAQAPLMVTYNKTNDTYTLVASDRSVVVSGSETTTFADDKDWVHQYQLAGDSKGYNYVNSAAWFRQTTNGTMDQYSIRSFVFGDKTPVSAVPVSGQAGFETELNGYVTDPRFTAVASLYGPGRFFVDFATGKISYDGALSSYGAGNNGQTIAGSYAGEANLSSARNNFSGTFSTSGDVGVTSGQLVGSLFGPAREEMGSAFATAGANGLSMSGVIVGRNTPDLVKPIPALAELPQTTSFTAVSVTRAGTNSVLDASPVTVTYNPTTKTYTMISGIYSQNSLGDNGVTFGPADLDSSKSNADYSVYNMLYSGARYPVRIYNSIGAGRKLALSYTSFADMNFAQNDPNNDPNLVYYYQHMYTVFGSNTPQVQMPRAGVGTYSGLVVGDAGRANSAGGYTLYQLTGTSQFSANFSNFRMTGGLTLQGLSADNATPYDFGNWSIDANLSQNDARNASFYGSITSSTGGGGRISGLFFGPQGAEVGSVFNARGVIAGADSWVQGVAVATKNN